MNIKVNVTLVKNQKVKGSATVVLDDCFKIRDIVILTKNDTGELYVAMPYKTLKNGNKISVAYPLNAEFRAELQQLILDEYAALLAKDEAKSNAQNENSSDPVADDESEFNNSSEEE